MSNDFARRCIRWLAGRGVFNWMPDEPYLKLKYWACMGKKLNLNNPQTFNEKLQWLKLHDRKPEYTRMVDKYEAKKYVAEIIGDQYIIPTLGVWDSFDDIDFELLPERFVLKCTHDSGGIVICKDKSTFDIESARVKINKSMKKNYFLQSREWPYKNVKHRIIAEQYMEDESHEQLKDYKVFNFNSNPQLIQVDFDRFKAHKKNLYTTDWEFIEKSINYPSDPGHAIDRPKALNEMLDLAKKLSANIPYLRTDFYSIDDKVYFGELTFFPGSGFMGFTPEEFGLELGNLIKLDRGGYLIKGEGYVISLIQEEIEKELSDYKIHCFNGVAKVILVCQDRFSSTGLTEDFFDTDWHHLEVYRKRHGNSKNSIPTPAELKQMLILAEKLSKDIPFVRVDCYVINSQIYFGELTFFPASGFERFCPDQFDEQLGGWIHQ